MKGGDGALKNGKKLTRDQKIMLTKAGWDPAAWLCVMDLPNSLILVHRDTGETFVFEKR